MTFDPSNSRILFVNPVEDKYRCVSCKDVLKDPVQSSCGHRLCTDCANDILKCHKPRCPDDNEEIYSNQLFKDRCAAKEIQALECYCREKINGCKWKGTVAELQEHVCPFEKVGCINEGCDAILLKCQLARHVEKDCSYREVECQFCFRSLFEINLDKHLEKCPKCLIECENKCGTKDMPREHMEEHLLLECPLAIRHCNFNHLGCQFKGTMEQIEEHMNNNLKAHLGLYGKYAEKSEHELETLKQKAFILEEQNRLLVDHLKAQNQALSSTRETLSMQQIKLKKVEEFLLNQNKVVEELKKKSETFSDEPELPPIVKILDELKDQVEFQSKKLKTLENELEKYNLETKDISLGSTSVPQTLRRKLDAAEGAVALHDVRLAEHDLRLSILDKCSYDGIFVWKIENYSQRFHEALTNKTPSLYSPPFYTARFGYKMCARIYLNGDGSGKGSHISLFISIMKGEYDAVLPWPFSKKITLKLLDQSRIDDITETFRPDPNSSSFMRPRTDMNIASGCPKFCTHVRLQTNGYLKENTIFVKIIIN